MCELEKEDLETEKFRGNLRRKSRVLLWSPMAWAPLSEHRGPLLSWKGPGQRVAESKFHGLLTWSRDSGNQLLFPAFPCFPDRTTWEKEPSAGWEAGRWW